MQSRVQIQAIEPSIDCGRYAAKAIVGDRVVVGADVFREGHELIAACVRSRGTSHTEWHEHPLRLDVNDRWYGHFRVSAVGAHTYQVLAWTDHYATWLDGLRKRYAAGRTDLELDLAEGAALLERRIPEAEDAGPSATSTAALRRQAARQVLTRTATVLGDTSRSLAERVEAASSPELQALLEANPERLDTTTSEELPLWVDREAARFSAWYEMFPRSEGAVMPSEGDAGRSGTFADAAKRLPAIAGMGFDVLYLPPIHPIGTTARKGPNNALLARPGDPGVPWAIGGPEGGHMAVHPDLGTIDDFDDFVAEARANGLEVALDFALQCSPDHPWVTEHPQWFRHRADGSIQYASNPPKEYQDIYPIDFDTEDYEGLREECERVLRYWISHGVTIFRVDNPHTKALPFWEWLIAEIQRDRPDVLFLAEAFTRPKMMRTLAKLGFSLSYTYFAWRNTKHELTEYATELSRGEMARYYRPSFWPNTPDILTDYLQHGGRPAFQIRLALAALLSPGYGVYSGYELYESLAVRPGSEEYMDSEKYQYRPRDWDRPDSLAPWIAQLNRIRREHPALRELETLWFHHVDDDQVLAFSKVTPDRTDPILVICSLDPTTPRESWTWLDLWQLGLEHAGPYEAHDLLTGTAYIWHGPRNYVRLDPAVEPAHVLRLRPL